MHLDHVANVSSTEKNADLFYGDLLGLDKMEPKTCPAQLAKSIFGLDREFGMINYVGQSLRFEIFITGDQEIKPSSINHSCLTVQDSGKFVDRCSRAGAEVIKIPKGNRFLYFVKDFDGNLFEIKESG